MTITLIVGTLAIIILATLAWHPGSDSTQLELLIFGVYFIGAGLGNWAVLGYMYRKAVPIPCRICGRVAHAMSLNPIEIRCSHCGEVETLRFRVHGAL